MMVFASREQAGLKLGEYLKRHGTHYDLVLGLPRGGLIVAAGVARELAVPLDALVVRKIGHPLYREFALGAMAEGGVVLLDQKVPTKNPLLRSELDRVIEEEEHRLHGYEQIFHHHGAAQNLAGKHVLLVDDGLATGSTMEAAVFSARKHNASRITVAVPVASVGAVRRLKQSADDVEALLTDPSFDAVGQYYDVFTQTTHEEALAALAARAS